MPHSLHRTKKESFIEEVCSCKTEVVDSEMVNVQKNRQSIQTQKPVRTNETGRKDVSEP